MRDHKKVRDADSFRRPTFRWAKTVVEHLDREDDAGTPGLIAFSFFFVLPILLLLTFLVFLPLIMSSKTPVVVPFPLCKLETDELECVMGFWTPYTLFQFSTISKKTKEMAKSLKKKPSTIKIWCQDRWRMTLSFSENNKNKDRWIFEPFYFTKLEQESYRKGFRHVYPSLFTGHPLQPFFDEVEQLQEIFNSSIGEIEFDSYSMPFEDMLPIIDWINNCGKIEEVGKIRVFYGGPAKNSLKVVLENFKKNLKKLRVEGRVYNIGDKIFFPEFPLKINNLDDISLGKWTTVDNLFAMNCVDTYIANSPLTNKDLNKFLRSWQEGKTNSRMRMWNLHIPEKVDWKVVLDGLSPNIRHPRTTKRSFICGSQQTFYIHGGIDIQRNDGTIATIQLLCHLTEDENEPIPDSVIKEYEEAVKDLNQEGDDVEVELDDWEVPVGMEELADVAEDNGLIDACELGIVVW